VRTIDEIVAAMDAVVAGAKAEDGTDRPLEAGEIEQYGKLEAELKDVQANAALLARHAAYHTPITGFPAVIKPQPKGDAAREASFSAYLRTGLPNTDMATFAQTEGTPSEGGYAVPESFRAKLVEGRSAFGGFLNAGEQLTTADGRPMAYPTIVAEVSTHADIAAEGAATAAGADFVFDEVTLGAYKYTSAGASNLPVKVSVELLQDAQFDVASFVARRLGERILRKQSYDVVRGAGSGEPLGILDGTAGDVATASGSVPTYAKLKSLEHALDPAYRAGASFLMNDTTLGVFESIVDAQGRPIVAPQTQGITATVSGRSTLLGYPVIIDQACADLSNNVQGVGFGLWNIAYVVRHVRDVQILVNPYAATGYIVYDAWARMDGTVQDFGAYVTMEGTT